MKGQPIHYSADELVWLEANRTWLIGDYHAGFVAQFARPDVSAQHLHGLRKRKGWRTGRTGCFVPGQAGWNKGVRCPEGRGGRHPNARAHQFAKGNVPANRRGLGAERLSHDGYIEISVAETNPHTGHARRFVAKHRHRWEAVNGPIPDGHALKCLDGDKANTDPDNWQAVPRGVLPRLAGGNRYNKRLAYDDAPDALRPAIMAVAMLGHEAGQRRKGKAQ